MVASPRRRRFVRRLSETASTVLMVSGMRTMRVFAIDGCKLPSNAAKEWSGTLEEPGKKRKELEALMEKIIAQHIQLDKEPAEEKGLSGAAFSYVYDKEYQEKHLERIEKKLGYIDEFLGRAEERNGSGGEEVKSNITDNESAKIKGSHGYIQGYNGIAAADSKSQVLVAAEAFGSGSGNEHFPAMMEAPGETMGALTGKEEALKGVIVEGDTGYFSEENLREAKERKIEALIPDQQFRKRDASFEGRPFHGGKKRFTAEDFEYEAEENKYRCPEKKDLLYKGHVKLNRNSGEKYQARRGDCKDCPLRERCAAGRGGNSPRTLFIADKRKEENLCGQMREKIDQVKYRVLYGRRMQIIEPCFADITYNKKMNRFTLRTKIKVNTQWLLYCIVHNIGKCMPGILAESGG
jgi:hypothetical protein